GPFAAFDEIERGTSREQLVAPDIQRRGHRDEEAPIVNGGDPGARARPQQCLQRGVEGGRVNWPNFFHTKSSDSGAADLRPSGVRKAERDG
ncbi:MAG: hypothetical protein QOJ71_862, partial [Actinomycetota bacterium]|nr:hypothetical protein [Actinomycetota bacterium]